MKIAILGAGNIGGTLGSKWLNAGHDVLFGVREASSPKAVLALNKAQGAQVMDVESAIRDGEALLFAVPWKALPEIAQANAEHLNGKLLIDATNNFGGPVINNLSALKESAPQAKSTGLSIPSAGKSLQIR